MLSRDDRMIDILERLQDHLNYGVGHIWVVDPWTRKLYTYDGLLSDRTAFALPEFEFRIEHADLFS